MGGVIVEMEGTIMDGSLRQRLRQVKEVMKE
jgi:F0F1-type ATP synthase delta subunit